MKTDVENDENDGYSLKKTKDNENMKHGWHLRKSPGGWGGGDNPPICKQNDVHNSSNWMSSRRNGGGRGWECRDHGK